MITAPDPANPFENDEELDRLVALFPDEIRMMMATLLMSKLGGLSIAECENPALQARLFRYFRHRLAQEQIYLYLYEVNENRLNLVKSLSELTDQARFTQATPSKTAVNMFFCKSIVRRRFTDSRISRGVFLSSAA